MISLTFWQFNTRLAQKQAKPVTGEKASRGRSLGLVVSQNLLKAWTKLRRTQVEIFLRAETGTGPEEKLVQNQLKTRYYPCSSL